MSNLVYQHRKPKQIALRTMALIFIALSESLGTFYKHSDRRTRLAIIYEDQVLVIQNITNFGKWTLPGGGYKSKETGVECIRREVREELNLDLSSDEIIESGVYHKKRRNQSHTYDTFFVKLNELPHLQLSWEIAKAKWVPIAALPNGTSPYIKDLLASIA